MTEYLTFDAMIEPLIWGDKTYPILPLPQDIVDALPAGTKRIEGAFGAHPVNLALTRAPMTPAKHPDTRARRIATLIAELP